MAKAIPPQMWQHDPKIMSITSFVSLPEHYFGDLNQALWQRTVRPSTTIGLSSDQVFYLLQHFGCGIEGLFLHISGLQIKVGGDMFKVPEYIDEHHVMEYLSVSEFGGYYGDIPVEILQN